MYGVAESAYRAMKNDLENQCVIISGESGAGKTGMDKKYVNSGIILLPFYCYLILSVFSLHSLIIIVQRLPRKLCNTLLRFQDKDLLVLKG